MKKTLTLLILLFSIYVAPIVGQNDTKHKDNIKKDNYLNEIPFFIEAQTIPIQTTQSQKRYKYRIGYIKGNVNVRKSPSKKAKIYTEYSYGTKVKYAKYNDKWSIVKYKGKNTKTAYIYTKYIGKNKPKSKIYRAPSNKIMSYMSYRAITNTSSKQYKLQKKALTGDYGIRQVDGRYCIAVGSYYTTKIGTYIDIILDNGIVIPCILADCKADKHTDNMNQKTADGSLVEFVVDVNSLPKQVSQRGCISFSNKKWNTNIRKIKVYSKKKKYK